MKILNGKKLADKYIRILSSGLLHEKEACSGHGLWSAMIRPQKFMLAGKKYSAKRLGSARRFSLFPKNFREKNSGYHRRSQQEPEYFRDHGPTAAPKHIDKDKIIEAIDPRKDADCLHPLNFGKIHSRRGKIFRRRAGHAARDHQTARRI